MRERVFAFGDQNSMCGILTEPDPAKRIPGAPIFVSSNVGMHQRIGPFRVYVELARELAEAGFSSLRFDLSGVGDSAPRAARMGDLERGEQDVRDAVDALAQRKVGDRFVLVGMCSGVDSTHRVACNHPAVVGAIFIEGYAFRTPRFYFNRYVRRLFKRRAWQLQAERKLLPLLRRLGGEFENEEESAELYSRAYPAVEELTHDYRVLIGKNCNLLFVFAGSVGSDQGYNYHEQFAETFPELASSALTEIEFYPLADHVFTALAFRRALVRRISGWARARFADAPVRALHALER